MDRGSSGCNRFVFCYYLRHQNVASLGLDETIKCEIMRVILATIFGLVIGNVVNMGIVGFANFPKTPTKPSENEAYIAAMNALTVGDYLIPLAAHLFGILSGLLIARFICKTSNTPIYIVGGLHLIASVIMMFIIPAPGWFIVLDLVVPVLLILYFLRLKTK